MFAVPCEFYLTLNCELHRQVYLNCSGKRSVLSLEIHPNLFLINEMDLFYKIKDTKIRKPKIKCK